MQVFDELTTPVMFFFAPRLCELDPWAASRRIIEPTAIDRSGTTGPRRPSGAMLACNERLLSKLSNRLDGHSGERKAMEMNWSFGGTTATSPVLRLRREGAA
jgi:hypothetical protein